MRRRVAWLLFVLAACAERKPAPARPPAPPPARTGLVLFQTAGGEVAVRVEIADTDEARARGLMYRRSLPADEGMLFIFPEETWLSFWMRNTYIPLDMIFINGAQEVVGVVENATPLTDTPRAVPRPSRFVVEVNAHFARTKGIGVGTRVLFADVTSPLLR